MISISLLPPYKIYKAWKSGSRPFIIWRKKDFRFIWGIPEKIRGKYTNPINGENWKIIRVI